MNYIDAKDTYGSGYVAYLLHVAFDEKLWSIPPLSFPEYMQGLDANDVFTD